LNISETDLIIYAVYMPFCSTPEYYISAKFHIHHVTLCDDMQFLRFCVQNQEGDAS